MTDQIIQDELARILQSPQFLKSKRLTDFLSYIVKAYLDNNHDLMSEIVIAQDVFNKNEDFDPTNDAIVRVTANRLRNALTSYYTDIDIAYYTDLDAPPQIQISIPVGSYTPKFSPISVESPWAALEDPIQTSKPLLEKPMLENAASEKSLPEKQLATKSWRANFALLVGAGIFAIAFIFFGKLNASSEAGIQKLPQSASLSEIQSYPVIAVFPFENMTGQKRFDRLESGFQRQIVRDIYAFDNFKVEPVFETLPILMTDINSPYSYAITGNLISLEPELNVLIKLIDISSGETISEELFTETSDKIDYFDIISNISIKAATDFARHRGILMQDKMENIRDSLKNNTLLAGDLTAFECFALFEQHFLTNTANTFQLSWDCVHEELAKNPNDATLTSAKALLYYQTAFFNENPDLLASSFEDLDLNPSISKNMSTELAKHAVTLNPKNDISLTILSEIQMRNGDYEDAKFTIGQILDRKKFDPDIISACANIEALLGNFEKADRLSKEALARTTNPQHYHYKPLLFSAVARKDSHDLRRYLKHYKTLKEDDKYSAVIFETTIAILEGNTARIAADKLEYEILRESYQGNLFQPLKEEPTPNETIEVLLELFESVDIKVHPNGGMPSGGN